MSRPQPRRERPPVNRIHLMFPAGIRNRGQEGFRVNSRDQQVREELVSRIRREIQAGTYDTPDKLQEALDRLADRLGGD